MQNRCQDPLALAKSDGLLVDGHVCSGDWRWLVALAFLRRRLGDEAGESGLLRIIRQQDAVAFWTALPDVYRFTVALPEMLRRVDRLQAAGGEEERAGKLKVWYFPAYALNAYQNLLYQRVVKSGGAVQPVKSLAELEGISPEAGRENVLHVHWLNAAWNAGMSQAEFAAAGGVFLELAKKIKARGFKLYWTVHNELSHRCVDPAGERALRRSFFELADRVYIHHPLVVELVDWLPADPKLRVIEHGSYRDCAATGADFGPVSGPKAESISRDTARRSLGIREDELLLFHFGLVRPYKDLQTRMPLLLSMLETEPRLKLLLAGQIYASGVKKMLTGQVGDRLIVRDEFVPEAELAAYGAAADFVFLSYLRILTSGSLFQAFTWGVPVIAPRLGTIPAYVAEGWNGFTYSSDQELKKAIQRCLRMSSEERAAMAANARTTAQSLRWAFP